MAALVALAVLLLWTTTATEPFAGVGPRVATGAAALIGLAVWTLASSRWSGSEGRAILEYDRLLLYATVFALFGLLGVTAARARLLVTGLAVGSAIIVVAALALWLFPDLHALGAGYERGRMSWPISYWNALGVLAALSAVWNLHLACDERTHPALRVLGAFIVPVAGAGLFFTVSRGSVLAVAVGLVAYLLLARPRGALTALLAVAPATASAVLLADRSSWTLYAFDAGYDVGALPFELAGVAMGGAVALALLLLAQRRWPRFLRPPAPPRAVVAAAALAAVVALAGYGVVDGAARATDAWDRFLDSGSVPLTDRPGDRFFELGSNGRVDHYEVALDTFEREPLHGTGAGTFALEWARERPGTFTVYDAHSLYLETLGELGLVGTALLAVVLLTMLVALATRSRGPDRAVWAALLAAAVTWAVHAGLDWDWEMPAVTLWLFAAGGLAAGRTPPAHRTAAPRPLRLGIGIGILVLAVVPFLVWRSQTKIAEATTALLASDCPTAVDAALDATEALGARAEPYELLAFCDVRLGQPRLALRAIDAAIERDPNSWEVHYGSALVRGAVGADPRPAIARAKELNPNHPYVRAADESFAGKRSTWRRAARAAPLPLPE